MQQRLSHATPRVSLETDAEGASPPEALSPCLTRQSNTLNPSLSGEPAGLHRATGGRGSAESLEGGFPQLRVVFLLRNSLVLLKMFAGATVSKAISITMGAEERSMLLE